MSDRFLWIDNTDPDQAEERIQSIKQTLESWSWSKWDEGAYASQNEAFADLVNQILTPPMFDEGKIILCRGIPKCQAKIAKELDEIPDRVMLILVARPDGKTSLYKKGKESDYAKMDDPLVLKGRDDAIEWLTNKAAKMGLELDETAGKMIVDFVGPNPPRLIMELRKLGSLSEGEKIFPWAVEQACHGTGMVDIRQLCESLVKADYAGAHEYMSRLLARGEAPIKICGYLMDWVRRMAMADSSQGVYQSIKGQVAEIKKFQKATKEDRQKVEDLTLKLNEAETPDVAKKLKIELSKAKKSLKGTSSLMFANPGVFFYSCNEYNEIGMKRLWAYWLIQRLGRIQLALRGAIVPELVAAKDERKIMHSFITEFRLVTAGEQDGKE